MEMETRAESDWNIFQKWFNLQKKREEKCLEAGGGPGAQDEARMEPDGATGGPQGSQGADAEGTCLIHTPTYA